MVLVVYYVLVNGFFGGVNVYFCILLDVLFERVWISNGSIDC